MDEETKIEYLLKEYPQLDHLIAQTILRTPPEKLSKLLSEHPTKPSQAKKEEVLQTLLIE